MKIGDRFGKYILQRPLKGGGFAQTWLAEDTMPLDESRRLVVLKIPYAQDEQLVKILTEAQTQYKICHPHICEVFLADSIDNTFVIVLKYYQGGDLAQYVQKSGPLPEDEVIRIITQIASGLAYAHQHNIIHRDIKPANVLLDNNLKAYVSDFGLATLINQYTGASPGVGTLTYMAPEQLTDQTTKASDVWSLGVMAYELLSGKRPFQANNVFAIMSQITLCKYTSLRQLVPDVSLDMEQIISKAMSKDITLRYQDADEFLKALRTLPGYDSSAESAEHFNITYRFREEFLSSDVDPLASILLDIRSRGESDLCKPICHVCLLLDVSGSMNDPAKYPLLLKATRLLLENMPENDYVSLAIFSAGQELVLAATPSKEVRSDNVIQHIDISGIKFGRQTLVSGVLSSVLDEIAELSSRVEGVLHRIYLLTDGQLHDLLPAVEQAKLLRNFRTELHAYGFGSDWSYDSLNELVSAVSTSGTIKPIPTTEDVEKFSKGLHMLRHYYQQLMLN